MNDKTELLKKFINESENIVFFGGAGVSTESGVPDFRSKNGLYNQHDVRFENYTPEFLLSHECLINEPEVFFEFYRQKMDTRKIKPNAAHYCLAELEKYGKLKAVVTQNIDGLHQLAGSKSVYEIHGTTKRNYCVKCKKEYPSDYIFESQDSIPRCGCGGIIRCDVTLYGESLPEDAVENAISAIYDADMLIVGGTSLSVYPAASFIRYFHGKHLAVINLDSLNCLRKGRDDIEINLPIGKVFSELLKK